MDSISPDMHIVYRQSVQCCRLTLSPGHLLLQTGLQALDPLPLAGVLQPELVYLAALLVQNAVQTRQLVTLSTKVVCDLYFPKQYVMFGVRRANLSRI